MQQEHHDLLLSRVVDEEIPTNLKSWGCCLASALLHKPMCKGFEPYQVCRRVNILIDYPDDKIKIYPWNQRKSGSIIDWIWKRLSIELGCDHRYCSLSSILRKGCTPETLRVWYQKYLDKQNPVKVQQLSDQERIKQLERENKELQRANEILRKAAAFFAQAELDRPHK